MKMIWNKIWTNFRKVVVDFAFLSLCNFMFIRWERLVLHTPVILLFHSSLVGVLILMSQRQVGVIGVFVNL